MIMQYAYAVFELIAGLGAFLLGVKLLSDNLEKLATDKLRRLFHKASGQTDIPAGATRKEKLRAKLKEFSGNLAGVGIGTVTTAVIQSSSLTTVMVVGLVNVGVMTLYQATGLIMGANIGTTITAQIAALQAFNLSAFATGLTGIGVLVAMFSKKEKVQTVSYAAAGLGLVFIGLEMMSDSMSFFRESEAVVALFSGITNPFLLFFLGLAITAIVQSSSAVTSILISMATAGIMIGEGGNDVFYVVLGTNIGTCVTALISALGANINAKRAAVIHLLFNCIGSLIFFVVLICWPNMAAVTFEKWFPGYPSTQIAMFHTFFNVICTVLFLPFSKGFVKLSSVLVREKKKRAEQSEEADETLLDKRLLATPSLAVENATDETVQTLAEAAHSLKDAVEGFLEQDGSRADSVRQLNAKVSESTQKIGDYLVKISAYEATLELEKRITALHSCLGDINRISELADNVTKYTRRSLKDGLHFSPKVKEEIKDMLGVLEEMSAKTGKVLMEKNVLLLGEIDEFENKVDQKRKSLIKDHIHRLGSGECRPESSGVFINLVCNLERVGDHLNYIAHAVEAY